MADFTKRAIRSSFIRLLNEKPLKQISVRSIVDDCGINRNTFYYHFEDIPALVESIIKEDADRIIRENPSLTSLEDCINALISFSLENRTAVLHIYRSVNRDLYEQHQWRVCDYIVSSYLEEQFRGRRISQEDRSVIISYIRSVCFGILMGWLEGGLQDNIQVFIHRICELKQGDLQRMLDQCEQAP